MWKNYLNVVLRGIWKYRAYSAINILGLAIGVACSLMILLYVQHELSYDRYHSNADRIYRVTLNGVLGGNEVDVAVTPYPMAAALENEYPQVERAGRLRSAFSESLVELGDISYQESGLFFADPQILEIFDFDFISGDPDTALDEPNTMLITEEMANKYFGEINVLGRTLTVNEDTDVEITGVIREIPDNSHFHPDFMVSYSSDPNHDSTFWVSNNMMTYVLLRDGSDPDEFAAGIQDLVGKYVAPQIEEMMGVDFEEFFAEGGRYAYGIQPLTDIHLYSNKEAEFEQNGSATYVYTFMALALFIMLLACINFMNLSTARSANRAREIGVRKVLGSHRQQLLVQFLSESVFISFLALLIALPAIYFLMPAFNGLTEKELSLDILFSAQAMTLLVFFIFIVGLLSGSYPALFLSQFHPQEVLKGKFSGGSGSVWFRRTLVVFQFAIAVALIAATLIVYNQLEYMRSKDLGFDQEQLLLVHRANALGDDLDPFLDRVKQLPGVVNASSSIQVPGETMSSNVYYIESGPANDSKIIWFMGVNYDFIETMGINMVEGRSFREDFGSEERAYILNERAVREFGITDPLSERIVEPDNDGLMSGPIIGVMEDFHFESLHLEIRPLILRIDDFSRYINVRLAGNNIPETIADLENSWNASTNDQPFEYSFLDEDLQQLYVSDRKMGSIFTGFAILAIIIACLGLYGLSWYTTEQRTKEIGIRKTLGAPVSRIVMLLSREFMMLVLVSMAIAVPVAWYGMTLWLQLFSYRVDISPLAFLAAGLLAALIAFVTISYQSARAALTNPVLTLRDE